MDVFEAIRGRRSIRKFTSQVVSEEMVNVLVEAARMAPTAGNAQAYMLVIVREGERKRRLSEAAFGQGQVQMAFVVFVVCADLKRAMASYGERGCSLYCLQDTAAVTENVLLTAYSLGLGTCWIGAFDETAVKSVINAPVDMRPVVMISIGYPAEMPMPRPRRLPSEFVHNETF
ncbi:MAG: nitroreductase family protein [Candidatus Bathyarchaeota archaeon]|nr:nitroreductase family protein [Candidatus Termiticorpusculum sp.]MCL1969864.1 nitroreductase family protein [Candidatus Termiticorpusculum sp.]